MNESCAGWSGSANSTGSTLSIVVRPFETDRIEEMRLNGQLAYLEPLRSQDAVSVMEITDLRLQRDEGTQTHC